MESFETNSSIMIRAGQWLGALLGCCWGVVFLIIGRLINWGPGGGLEGPFSNALVMGIPSAVAGAVAGVLIMKKSTQLLLRSYTSPFLLAIKGMGLGIVFGGAVLAVSLATSFVISFYTGGIIWEEGMGIVTILQASAMMGLLWGGQLGSLIGISFGLYTFYFMNMRGR